MLMVLNFILNLILYLFLKIFFVCINFRETEEGGERETSICCSTYLCILWLLLVCA